MVRKASAQKCIAAGGFRGNNLGGEGWILARMSRSSCVFGDVPPAPTSCYRQLQVRVRRVPKEGINGEIKIKNSLRRRR